MDRIVDRQRVRKDFSDRRLDRPAFAFRSDPERILPAAGCDDVFHRSEPAIGR